MTLRPFTCERCRSTAYSVNPRERHCIVCGPSSPPPAPAIVRLVPMPRPAQPVQPSMKEAA